MSPREFELGTFTRRYGWFGGKTVCGRHSRGVVGKAVGDDVLPSTREAMSSTPVMMISVPGRPP